MKPDQVDLSIIIVNWNTREMLAECLRSIEDCRLKIEDCPSSIETIVVDNASGDGSEAMVRERFPWVTLIENATNVGFAAANNQAMREEAGRYILLLNSDTIVPAGVPQALIDFADDHPRAGIVGVRLINPDGTFQAGPNHFPTTGSVVLESWGLTQLLTRNPYYPSLPPERSQDTVQCDWVGGACLLARREAIERVGPLDEAFFMNSEEVDWCRRMKQAKWEVWYDASISVTHFGGASASRSSVAQRTRNYRGKTLYLRKHAGSTAGAIVAANFRASSLAKALAFGIATAITKRAAYEESAVCHWHVAWGKW